MDGSIGDDNMKDEKKKKGMVVVIAVGGKSPKAPERTADPDNKKKMDDAWQFLKEERQYDYGKGNAPYVLSTENINCSKCNEPYYHYLGFCEECGHMDQELMSSVPPAPQQNTGE